MLHTTALLRYVCVLDPSDRMFVLEIPSDTFVVLEHRRSSACVAQAPSVEYDRYFFDRQASVAGWSVLAEDVASSGAAYLVSGKKRMIKARYTH